MDSQPLVLTYDTQPSHSRLRREVSEDGTLTILAAAEAPGPLVRRSAAVTSAITAGIITFVLMSVMSGVFGSIVISRARVMPTWLQFALLVLIVVFFVALYLLVWRVQYGNRLEQLDRALSQSTAIAASKGRLIIESSGLSGTESRSIDFAGRRFDVRIATYGKAFVCCLELEVDGKPVTQILPGRDQEELRWVARELTRAIRQ